MGVASAKYVKITDLGALPCSSGITNNGFDLDAIAAVHVRSDAP
jgi:hypothetical protein